MQTFGAVSPSWLISGAPVSSSRLPVLNLAVLQIMHFFLDLVLFQLKRTCLKKFKKSLQKKKIKRNL